MQQLLTVCIGNICRSPIAEALLKSHFADKTIWSAGIEALSGNPADPLSIKVAAARGLDLTAHRAQQLSGWMCKQADLILVMEQGHKTLLEERYPLARGKIFRLGEVGKFEIEDPYRKPEEAFEIAFERIDQGVADWADRIRKLG